MRNITFITYKQLQYLEDCHIMWLAGGGGGGGREVWSGSGIFFLFFSFFKVVYVNFLGKLQAMGQVQLIEWVKVYERWDSSTLASRHTAYNMLYLLPSPTQAAYSCGHDFHGLLIFKIMCKYNDSSCLQRSKTTEMYISVFISAV